MDGGRRTHCLNQRKAGSKFQGPQLIGSLTLSVDMSKAFDMVDRTLLRKALEDIQMDPELIEIIGKLHVDALYKMTVDGTDFSVMTKRGIKQGCKLAPSLFAISTALFLDDTNLQEHFRNKKEFEQALTHCSVLLKTLAEMGFKVNPKKSALLITVAGSSAQQELAKYRVKIKGEGDHLKLPDGNLIPIRRTAPYSGVIISYNNYEDQTLKHRQACSKQVMRDVSHVIANDRALPELKRLQIWQSTAWASATYALHVVGLTAAGLHRLTAAFTYQARFVTRSFSRVTHEQNSEFLHRKCLTLPKDQLQARSQSFLQRQLGKHEAEADIVGSYLSRHQSILASLDTLTPPLVNLEEKVHITCEKCGLEFSSLGPLRRHIKKSHDGDFASLKGPRFDPKYHALPSTTTCKACNFNFRTFFHLKKHVEASTCPHREKLWKLADGYLPDEEAPAAVDRPSVIAQVASDPGDAALNPAYMELLRERCCLCSQKLAMKGVKQHLNKQHSVTMSKVWSEIEPKLDTFKVMVKKGQTCRFCGIQVDAPGRHVRQCVPLLQAHVVQSTLEHGLSKEQESSKAKRNDKRAASPAAPLSNFSPNTQLTCFLRLSNTANHCYANSVLQCLWWQQPQLRRDPPLSEPFTRGMLSIINPEHPSFRVAAAHWIFDGTQKDAAEFLQAILLTQAIDILGRWESRSQLGDGSIREDVGVAPIPLIQSASWTLQDMITAWHMQAYVHALSLPFEHVALQVPRFTQAGKNEQPLQLPETVGLPIFSGEALEIRWEHFKIVALVHHIGHSPHQGHYRACVLHNRQWFHADDSAVPHLVDSANRATQSGTYLLFLTRIWLQQ